MTVAKGQAWGSPGPLPPDGIIVSTDAEAGAAIATARREGIPLPTLGLTGGDLCTTVGGRGELARLTSDAAVMFPIDIGWVVADGEPHAFVAHAVARTRWWTRAVVVCNAAWLGDWNIAPRSHPNDGLLDVYDARLRVGDLRKVRRRLPAGAHLPHPGIRERRTRALEVTVPRPLRLWVDGVPVGRARRLEFTVEPDALTVVV